MKLSNMKSLKITDLSKKYDADSGLDTFSYEFVPGSISCIMGESGIGKTTLLRLIMGLEIPDSGEITGISNDTSISVVFQEDRLCDNLSAFTNVFMICGKSRGSGGDIKNGEAGKGKGAKQEVEEHLKMLLPKEAIYKKASQLSGGMRQKVSIVRAMVADSDIVLMDEPFKGLDAENKLLVVKYIKSKLEGRILIVVTHDREDADMLGAGICLLTKE